MIPTYSQTGIAVHGLHEFRALVVHHPVGIDLGVAFRVQHHRLVRPEVRGEYLRIVGTVVQVVGHGVVVVVVLAYVPDAVACAVTQQRT